MIVHYLLIGYVIGLAVWFGIAITSPMRPVEEDEWKEWQDYLRNRRK